MNCPLAIVTEVKKKKGYRGGKLQERRVTVSFVEFYFHLVEKKKMNFVLKYLGEKKKDNCDLLGNSYCEQF